MGAFSTEMRNVATNLIREFGNRCVLTKVVKGPYDPLLGKTVDVTTDFSMFSAQSSRVNLGFGLDGQNTNLAGFNDERIIIPWFGHVVDVTWLYNGQNITDVMETKTQDDIVIFNLNIAEK